MDSKWIPKIFYGFQKYFLWIPNKSKWVPIGNPFGIHLEKNYFGEEQLTLGGLHTTQTFSPRAFEKNGFSPINCLPQSPDLNPIEIGAIMKDGLWKRLSEIKNQKKTLEDCSRDGKY